jgi:hypothetical protein
LKPTFDNLDDVISKFTGTVCMYDDKAAIVKSAHLSPEDQSQYVLIVQTSVAARGKTIKLLDPAFKYTNFNLGYANNGPYASWWYRRPAKQYRQGLKADQMYCRISDRNMESGHFNFNGPFIRMLENTYPTLESAHAAIKDQVSTVCAFNKDFAVSWDSMHEDFIVEYRGTKIGVSQNLKEFKLREEHRYLTEALMEVIA